MNTDRSSLELLSHFDRPQRVISPDFDWDESDCGAAEFDPVAVVDSKTIGGSLEARCAQLDVARHGRPQTLGFCSPPIGATGEPVATIGVCCVLKWGAAVAVLAIAAGVLVEFGQGIAAENALRVAARAGATEATLPKATYASVAAAVERRLAAYPELQAHAQLTLLKNGVPVGEPYVASGGDRISVTVSAPASAMVPGWIAIRDEPPTIVEAQSQVPGRKLCYTAAE